MIIHADVLTWLRGNQWQAQHGYLPRVHAVFGDPPYFLGSIAKRFGGKNAAPAQYGRDGAFQRQSRGFMGQTWDGFDDVWEYQAWVTEWATLLLDFVHPGALLAMFGGTRTYHRLAAGLEDAGWEVFDCMMYVYGSGFPKAADIGKLIDKSGGVPVAWFGTWLREWRLANGITQKEIAKLFPSKTGGLTGCVANWELGLNMPTPEQFNAICRHYDLPFESIEDVEREVVGFNARPAGWFTSQDGHNITAPATDAAKQWDGYKTALKPAYEPLVLARAPRDGLTYAQLAQCYGTAAINVDAGRIGFEGEEVPRGSGSNKGWCISSTTPFDGNTTPAIGRYPANLILDDDAAALMDAQSGERLGSPKEWQRGASSRFNGTTYANGKEYRGEEMMFGYGDSGGASRFFYTAKAPAWEREAGLADFQQQTVTDGRDTPIDNPYQRGETVRRNIHPTVKPIQLTEYIARLMLPPMLDVPRRIVIPFAGVGSEMIGATLAGWDEVIGIEREANYAAINEARRKWWGQFRTYEQAQMAYRPPAPVPSWDFSDLPLFAAEHTPP